MGFTFFFRDRHTLNQLLNQALPQFKNTSELKIWDAGCSNGSEPFTLAIMIAEELGLVEFSKRVTIYASDVNISSGFDKMIQTGIYEHSMLTRMPEGILEKYFYKHDEDNYKIQDYILKAVKFVHHDLLTLIPFDTNFNIVLCKNVLLHFSQEQRIQVIDMYKKVLVPNGFLCTEQTQPLPDENAISFTKVVSDANIFQKK